MNKDFPNRELVAAWCRCGDMGRAAIEMNLGEYFQASLIATWYMARRDAATDAFVAALIAAGRKVPPWSAWGRDYLRRRDLRWNYEYGCGEEN